MKCIYNQSKRGLPSDVRTMALKVAKEMLALQVDAVVSRAWNEMLVAMEQSGLSAKTINKTREKLTEVVLPYVDELRNPDGGLKNAGNPQNVRDGDIWIQAYLVARGIKAFDVPEVDYGEDHV